MYHSDGDVFSDMSSSNFPMIIGDLLSYEMKMTTAETINSLLSDSPYKLENLEKFEKNDFLIDEDSQERISNLKKSLKDNELLVNIDNIPMSLISPSGKIKNEMFIYPKTSKEFSSENDKDLENSKSEEKNNQFKKEIPKRPKKKIKNFLGKKKPPPQVYKKYEISQNTTKEVGFEALELYKKISKIEETDPKLWEHYDKINSLKKLDQDVVYFMRDFYMLKEISKFGKRLPIFVTKKSNSNQIKNPTVKKKTKKLIDMSPEEQQALIEIIQNLTREQVKQIRKYLRNSEKMNPENFKFSLNLVKNTLWNKFVSFLSDCNSKNKENPLHVPWNDPVKLY
jgi:hypothetical protein